MFNPQFIVDSENTNCGSGNGRKSDDYTIIQSEVFGPNLIPWMIQWLDRIGLWINACDIRSFEQTACRTTQSQILQRGRAVVLLRTDVIEMKRSRVVGLWQQAVFTTAACPLPYQLTQRRHHLTIGRFGETALAQAGLWPAGFQSPGRH